MRPSARAYTSSEDSKSERPKRRTRTSAASSRSAIALAMAVERDWVCGLPLMKTTCLDILFSLRCRAASEVAAHRHVQALVDVAVALDRVSGPVHVFGEHAQVLV